VIINEINWVGGTGGNDEWLELINTSDQVIDISGWVIENAGTGSGVNQNIVLPSNSLIPAESYFLISKNSKEDSNINVDPDFITSNLSLHDGGEQLILKTSVGEIIDIANGTGAWFAGSNSVPKSSMEKKNPLLEGTLSNSWQTATTQANLDPVNQLGTPKAPNGI